MNIIREGGHILNPDIDGRPVLFLDVDGTIASENGGPIDRDAVVAIANTVRLAQARIILCTDRVRHESFYDEIIEAGIPGHMLRGQCDPDEREVPSRQGSHAMSSKVARVIRYLTIAENHCITPSAWCVLDDARTFSYDWRTATQHVAPSGPLVTELDLRRVWILLTRRLPHSLRREVMR